MIPVSETLSAEIHTAIVDRILLRAENDRLRALIRLMRDPRIAAMARDDAARGVSFDWRLVLYNPQFNWPADVIADAKMVRDAEKSRFSSSCP